MKPPLTHKVPQHIAIIMDGNGRWAQSRGEPRVHGHRSGAQRVREVVEAAGQQGVKVLTLYAFSEENWQRPIEEVHALFSLLVSYLREEIERLHENGVQLCSIGAIEKLPEDCQQWLRVVEERTRSNQGLKLVLALSYSSRTDILRAVRGIAAAVKEGTLDEQSIGEATINSYLSTNLLPEPDLLIRTSGEQRLSNFLLWEMAYTEFYFTKVHWPDFSRADLEAALSDYAERERRFGSIHPQ